MTKDGVMEKNDVIQVRLSAGDKAIIKAHARKRGLTVSEFVLRALYRMIEYNLDHRIDE